MTPQTGYSRRRRFPITSIARRKASGARFCGRGGFDHAIRVRLAGAVSGEHHRPRRGPGPTGPGRGRRGGRQPAAGDQTGSAQSRPTHGLTGSLQPLSAAPRSCADGTLLSQIQRDIKFEITSSEQGSRPTTIAFKITYTGRDPDTVASVANRLASFYVEKNDTMRTRQATRATELLKQSLGDTRKRLDGQEARMQSFLSRNVGRLPQQMDANLLALTRLNGQIQFNAEQQNKLMERRQEIQKQISDLDMSAASAMATTTSDPSSNSTRPGGSCRICRRISTIRTGCRRQEA